MEKSNLHEIIVDKSLVAYCGLYCGACRAFLRDKCPGCKENAKATWCKIRKCCADNGYLSCADCKIMKIEECKKFNNFISKLYTLFFKSDRNACIQRIKEIGYEYFAAEMAKNRTQTIKKK